MFCTLIRKLDPTAIGEVTPEMDAVEIGRLAHEGAVRLGVQTFTQPRDLSPGNSRLCLSFLAQLFNARTGFEDVLVSSSPVRAPATVRVSEKEHMTIDVPVIGNNQVSSSAQAGGLYFTSPTVLIVVIPDPRTEFDIDMFLESDEYKRGNPEASCFGIISSLLNMLNPVPLVVVSTHENDKDSMTIIKDEYDMMNESSIPTTSQELPLHPTTTTTTTTSVQDSRKSRPFFDFDNPEDAAVGLGNAEYNLVKGVIAGPVLMVMAPITAPLMMTNTVKSVVANENLVDSNQNDAPESQAQSESSLNVSQIGRGLVRSLVGGPSLVVTGLVTATNQMYHGIRNAESSSGLGENWLERWHHIHDSSLFTLASNSAPPDFATVVYQLIQEKKLPPKIQDEFGNEIGYSYQFFKTTAPNHILEGFRQFEYNICKGVIVGTTLLLTAPGYDATKFYENEGIGGAVKGCVRGVVRGVVGGVVLITAGPLHATHQLIRGIVSPNNIQASHLAVQSLMEDIHSLATKPILHLLLPTDANLDQISRKTVIRAVADSHQA